METEKHNDQPNTACPQSVSSELLAARIAGAINAEYYLSRDKGCPDCSPLWLDNDVAIERLIAIILPQLAANKE